MASRNEIPRIRALGREALAQAGRFGDLFSLANQVTPFGSQTFTRDRTGKLTRTVSLSPTQQALVDERGRQDIRRQSLIGDLLKQAEDRQRTAFDFSTLPESPTLSGNDFSQDRRRIEEALFNRSKELLLPEFEKQRRRQEQLLTNRGIPLGSELQLEQQRNLERTINDALSGELARAIATAGQEQSRLQSLELGKAQAQQALRQAALQEGLLQRSIPVQEAAALLAQQAPLVSPNFLSPSEIGSAPLEAGFSAANLGLQASLTDAQLEQQRRLADRERRAAARALADQLKQQQRQFEARLRAEDNARINQLLSQNAVFKGQSIPLPNPLPNSFFTLPQFRI